MITIGFCGRVPNREQIDHLIKTSGVSKSKLEIIEMINDGNESLSESYNKIISYANNNIVVLCHDDILFDTKNWGVKLLKLYSKNPEYGVIGVAGTTDLINGAWWDIKKSMCGVVRHTHEGKTWESKYSADQGDSIKEVVTLDGLFISFKVNKIKSNFNENYKGYHLYDTTFCVDNYLKGVKIGLTTKIKITHKSIGETNEEWLKNKEQFDEEYKTVLPITLSDFKTIEESLNFDINSIGIGITTFNSSDRIKISANTIPKWIKNFVIVNDGEPYDDSDYPDHATIIQHEYNKGVGPAKNTAIKYLQNLGCEHIFLIEDDMVIKDENVFNEYIKHSIISGIKHLSFGLHGPANKTSLEIPTPRLITNYDNDVSIAFYPNSVGSFVYFHNSILNKVGLFDEKYKNAWEHVDHTYRIIKEGFHPSFWYFADINNSSKYINEIPNSIENTTIPRNETWLKNNSDGLQWFKKQHGIRPMEIPLQTPEIITKQLQFLFDKRI